MNSTIKQLTMEREGTARSSQQEQGLQQSRDLLASQASNRSRLPSTRSSQRAVTTAGSILNGERERPASSLSGLGEENIINLADKRKGTSYSCASRMSKASQRSKSSLGTSSTLTRNSEELLTRIRGLEDALLQEKQLRERMQSMLTLDTFAENR